MADELYPGASFAAPFTAAASAAPLARIPGNILQTMQAARQQAREDAKLRLQEQRFAEIMRQVERKEEMQDIDRELGSLQDPDYGGMTSTGRTGRTGRRRTTGGYGGPAGGVVGPASAVSQGLSPTGQTAMSSEVQAEQALIGGFPTIEEGVGAYGRGEAEEAERFRRQQAGRRDWERLTGEIIEDQTREWDEAADDFVKPPVDWGETDLGGYQYGFAEEAAGEIPAAAEGALMSLFSGEAPTEGGSLPPLSAVQGNEFRAWVHENYPEEATKKIAEGGLDLSPTGSATNDYMKRAWAKYGGQYLKGEAGDLFDQLMASGSADPENYLEMRTSEGPLSTEDLLAGKGHVFKYRDEYRDPDQIYADFDKVYREHLRGGGSPMPLGVLQGMLDRAHHQGPAPELSEEELTLAAQGFLQELGQTEASRDEVEAHFVEKFGTHPELAALVANKVEELGGTTGYMERRYLEKAGLLKPGEEFLSKEDIDANPATRAGLSADYAENPNMFNKKLYRTEWGKGLSKRARSQVAEDYRLWYKERVGDRRKKIMSALEEQRQARLQAQEEAFEGRVQSLMSMAEGKGVVPDHIRKDKGRRRQWAVQTAMGDEAHKEITSNWSSGYIARVKEGADWAEFRRKDAKDKRTQETEDSRTRARYNEKAAGLIDDKTRGTLEQMGVVLFDDEGNYRSGDELAEDIRKAAGQHDLAGQFEVVSEGLSAAQTEAEAKRETKIPEAKETTPGSRRSERMTALGRQYQINSKAYARAVGGGLSEQDKSELKALESDYEAAAGNETLRMRAQQKMQDFWDKHEVPDVTFGDPALLKDFEKQQMAEYDRYIREVGAESPGGGGGRTANPSPGPGYARRETRAGKEIWYNKETKESSPYWAGE